MWTFRKALVAAVVLVALFMILRSSHSSPHSKPIGTGGITKSPAQASTTGKDENGADSLVTVGSASGQTPGNQKPLEDISSRPLRKKLEYLFPYDLPSKFPAYIWQTWKYTPADGSFDEDLRPAEASWSEKHPGFIHEVVSDDQAEHLIKYLYVSVPEVYEAFVSLPVPVLKADFFRYLILLARGGIYSDIDTLALKPTLEWLPEGFKRETVGLIIGIEVDAGERPDWQKWYSRNVQFCQWTMQAKPGHPVLVDVVARVTETVLRMKKAGVLKADKMDRSVVEFTGPAIWTDTIMDYFNNPRFFDLKGKNITAVDFRGIKEHKKVGDVIVLPITSFSPGVNTMGAEDEQDEMAFVKHNFAGSWKSEEDRNIGHRG